jgi:hypothetical protein
VRFNKEDAGHTRRGSIQFCIIRRPRQPVGQLRRAAQRARGEYGYGRRQSANEQQGSAWHGSTTWVPCNTCSCTTRTPPLGILVVVLNETTPDQLRPFSYNHPPSWARRNSLKIPACLSCFQKGCATPRKRLRSAPGKGCVAPRRGGVQRRAAALGAAQRRKAPPQAAERRAPEICLLLLFIFGS